MSACEDDPSYRQVAISESKEQLHATAPNKPNFLCDDLLKSLGPQEAYPACLEQAKAGNLHAQATLGAMYAKGQLGKEDWKQANYWLLQAGSLGHPEAQYIVSRNYDLGRGVDKNPTQALQWLKKAAQSHYPLAQAKLGMRYIHGDGVEKNASLAFQWLSKSAEQENLEGLYHLADLYLEGNGVEKDIGVAEKLLLIAAHKNSPLAIIKLADIYCLGLTGVIEEQKANYWYFRALELKSTEALYQIGQRILDKKCQLAIDPIKLLIAAANEDHPKAQLALAKLFHYGEKFPRNEEIAFQWYIKAANQNEPEALFQIGLAYFYGYFNQPIDQEKGILYLKAAEKNNYYPAQYALSSLSTTGEIKGENNFQKLTALHKEAENGSHDAQIKLAVYLMNFSLPQYDKAAFYWATKAAKNTSIESMFLLGTCYFEGIGTPINYEKAFAILMPLAEQNHHLAQFKVAQLYFEGHGAEKNIVEAKKWLMAAVQAGVEEAKNWAPVLFKVGYSDEDLPSNIEWINYAAEQGDPQALYYKGISHLYAKSGFIQDTALGMALLQLSAQKNNLEAQRELGNIYMQDLFGQEDLTKAHAFYMQAAKQGDSLSQYRVAHMYYYGLGVERSFVQSYVFATMAAKQGIDEAIQMIEDIQSSLEKDELTAAKNTVAKYAE